MTYSTCIVLYKINDLQIYTHKKRRLFSVYIPKVFGKPDSIEQLKAHAICMSILVIFLLSQFSRQTLGVIE